MHSMRLSICQRTTDPLGSDRTGYNAPAMAFDSRRICLMKAIRENRMFIECRKDIEYN